MATLSPAELHDRLLFDRSRLRVLHDHVFPIAVRGHRSAEDAHEARAEVPWTDPNPPIHYVIEYGFDTLIAPGRSAPADAHPDRRARERRLSVHPSRRMAHR